MNKHIKFEARAIWNDVLDCWLAYVEIDGQTFTATTDEIESYQVAEAREWLFDVIRKSEVIEV